MALLDDLQKLGFGKELAGSIDRIHEVRLINALNSELEKIKAEQKEPTPAQETLQQAQENMPSVQSEKIPLGVFPEATTELIPSLMRDLDRTSEFIRKKSDVYNRFIPAIAMVNPQLARTIAEDQIKSEATAFRPIQEKVGLAETKARLEESASKREQLAKDKREHLDYLYLKLFQDKKVADAKNIALAAYRRAIVNRGWGKDVVAGYNLLWDNVQAAQNQRDKLMRDAEDISAEIKAESLFQKKGKDRAEFIQRETQERLAPIYRNIDDANQTMLRLQDEAQTYYNAHAQEFGNNNNNNGDGQIRTEQEFINAFINSPSNTTKRLPTAEEISRARSRYGFK